MASGNATKITINIKIAFIISILVKIYKRNIPQNYIFGAMHLNDIWQDISSYAQQISPWELAGLIFGILSVLFLIKESIYTWPTGITYVLVSFVVFWEARLYGDFILHVFFLVLNIYGWYLLDQRKKRR